jgi:hypothetical protein
MLNRATELDATSPVLRSFYKAGGVTVLITVLVPFAEMAIYYLTGVAQASQRTVTVTDWFTLYQDNWFLGLRNLGLLNLIGASLLTPTFLAMYFALRRRNEPWAALGTVLYFMGMAVYLASNRSFAMLSLSGQYASAATDAQRSMLAAAGQTMLVEGLNRMGIFLIDSAGLVISAVMLRSEGFSKAAYAGVLGNGLMIVFEIILAFVPAWRSAGLGIAVCGGLSIMTWYLMVGRRLLQLGSA